MSSRAWKALNATQPARMADAEELRKLRALPLTETVEIVVRAETPERAQGLRDELVKLLRTNAPKGATVVAEPESVQVQEGFRPLYQRLFGVLRVSVSAEELKADTSEDEFLEAASRECKCCPSCWQHPCAGCCAGGICDEMACCCNPESEIGSDDDEEERP